MGTVRTMVTCAVDISSRNIHNWGESVGKPLLTARPPVLQASRGWGWGINLCAAHWERGLSPAGGAGGWAV